MQNAQVPSANNAPLDFTNDLWLLKFQNQFTNRYTNNENMGQVCSGTTYSYPISVKPKTREPVSFTDNRIYVSNIPFSFREQDLAAMFYPYGRVLSVEIVTNDRGSKGFGFVTLDSIEACERARTALHESHVQGRIIEVRRATPTRRKMTTNAQSEITPPPKLCVDLRAPHSLWKPLNNQDENIAGSHHSLHPSNNFSENENAFQRPPSKNRKPLGVLGDCNQIHGYTQNTLRCKKHSDLKLSSNGDYYLKNGEPTTENSLLMCMNGHQSCKVSRQSPKKMFDGHESSDVELPVFPNHIRDQINALLDTSNHPANFDIPSSPTLSCGRPESVVSSGMRTSESEVTSDEELHIWNHSPVLNATYE